MWMIIMLMKKKRLHHLPLLLHNQPLLQTLPLLHKLPQMHNNLPQMHNLPLEVLSLTMLPLVQNENVYLFN
jgi:hypothetical protein